MSNQPPCAVGIDVAKASLSVCLLYPDGTTNALSIRNIEADITSRLLPRLSGLTGQLVMEATNYYHWLVALIVSEQGYDVYVVNPLTARKYTHSSVRPVKTDPVDAAGLAQMAHLESKLPARFTATRKELALRKKIGFIASLRDQLQAISASTKSLAEAKDICGQPLTAAEQLTAPIIKQLKYQIKALEAEVVVATREGGCSKQLKQLTTVPGVSAQVAALAVHFFDSSTAQGKSWVGYAGLDVSVKQSGVWRGRCKLTKRGHHYLRRRLYSAAWGAIMNDDQFRDYYDYLRSHGRGHVEALIIIARKLVRIMAAMTRHHTTYDSSYPLYSIT